jgi:hypothetical protein
MAGNKDDALKSDICDFLASNPAIRRIKFGFPAARDGDSYRVYPEVYTTAVRTAIADGIIKVHISDALPASVGAQYSQSGDVLKVHPSFTISHPGNQAVVIHECTHAYLDMLNLGKVPSFEWEAVAYVAEAIFLGASGLRSSDPVSRHIREVAFRIAKDVLDGLYDLVPAGIAAALVSEIAKEPSYANASKTVNSNGFNRTVLDNIMR